MWNAHEKIYIYFSNCKFFLMILWTLWTLPFMCENYFPRKDYHICYFINNERDLKNVVFINAKVICFSIPLNEQLNLLPLGFIIYCQPWHAHYLIRMRTPSGIWSTEDKHDHSMGQGPLPDLINDSANRIAGQPLAT